MIFSKYGLIFYFILLVEEKILTIEAAFTPFNHAALLYTCTKILFVVDFNGHRIFCSILGLI